MIKRFSFYLILYFFVLSFACSFIQAMIYDNKYFPLYLKPFVRKPYAAAHFQLQPFFMRADVAQGDLEETSIPDLDGKYDLIQIIEALRKTGCLTQDPLRSDLQGLTSIPFKREGRIDSQGLAFFYEYPLGCDFWGSDISIGTSFLFMHVNARQEFCLDASCLDIGAGDKQYLFNLKDRLNCILGVTPPIYNRTVFGDIDFYLRWAHFWPYTLKFRSIDIGLKLGVYIPSSPRVPINNPAAIPVGGQRHWGIYFDLENQYEIKEDWYARVMFRAIKRFKNTHEDRVPVALEPSNYGAIIAPVKTDPGWSFVFNPSIRLEGIRDGFGVTALYTLVAHLKDQINDQRCDLKIPEIPVNIGPVERRSSWGAEYITVGAFYDFTKFKETCRSLPVFSVYWDIPVDWLVSERSSKTNAISITVDFDF